MSSDNEQTEPLENTPGDEPGKPDLNETLLELNSNMGATRYEILLQKLVESSFNRPTGLTETTPIGLAMNMPIGDIEGPTGSSMNGPTSHIESTGQGMLSTSSIGSNQSSAPKPGLSNKRKRAATSKEHNLSEPPAKTHRDEENGDDDTISIHANEDLEQDKDEHPETGRNKDNEFLDEIAEGFEVSDNVNEKLAEFVENRWGKQLKTEKIKSILEKYRRPKSCKKLHPIKVNKGAWENLKWEKKTSRFAFEQHAADTNKSGLHYPENGRFYVEKCQKL
eukprot:Seg472.5 transcript_id=Seg472.5/GoldUCD/mRNA.D3Y31 product="hypothetical protein" protein_id=Seg472.5/GoldUCD/D3Y31